MLLATQAAGVCVYVLYTLQLHYKHCSTVVLYVHTQTRIQLTVSMVLKEQTLPERDPTLLDDFNPDGKDT